MTGQGLSKRRRLHLKNDFKTIIQDGKRIQVKQLVLWYKSAPAGQTEGRIGIVVSKKLGGAVVRVRTKRLLREAFRLNREKLQGGVDYIFSPRHSEDWITRAQAEQFIRVVCEQGGLIKS